MESAESGNSERIGAYRRLVEETIVALGLLGPSKSHKKILDLLSDEARKTFGAEAFANPGYESRGYEMVEAYLLNGIKFHPFMNAIEVSDGKYVLSDVGQVYFREIMAKYDAEPDAYAHIRKMMNAVIELNIDEL